MAMVHHVLSATREVSRSDNGRVLSDLIQIIAAQRPEQLDKASLTVQGALKTCLDCGHFAAAKSILAAVLRLRLSALATARHTHHAKTITTTSWSYFARTALHSGTSDAALALAVLEKQARPVIEDITSDQPLNGGFKVAFAQTLAQLAQRADNTPSWYNRLQTKIDACQNVPQELDESLAPPDDPFAPGAAADDSSEIDALELTADLGELDVHVTQAPDSSR